MNSGLQPGFACIRRRWQNGDRIVLNLPMVPRLEAVDAQHPDMVALCIGPLALFAVHTTGQALPRITRAQLLSARKTPTANRNDQWLIDTPEGSVKLVPFTSLKDEKYSAYMHVKV